MKSPLNEELESWKDAVWSYLIEHSDITREGSFFVKFHTKDRSTFEKHIKGRHKYGYHRVDDRTDETHIEKEKRAAATRAFFQSEKKRKHEKWKATQEERRKIFAELKERNSRPQVVHTRGDATASMFVVLYKYIRHAYTIVKTKIRASFSDSEKGAVKKEG